MQAQFFGESARPLFGLRHEAMGQARRTAVLICPSFGLEALRTHRGLKQLATALAARGFEVLRFDYSGTGDSAGEGQDSRLEHWLQDIATAAQELRDSSGRERISLFGLRLGALLAAEAVQKRLVRAESLVTFDAPASGEAFTKALQQIGHDLDAHKNRFRSSRDQLPAHGKDELLGFDWPAPLATAIAQLPAASHPKLLWAQSQSHNAAAPAGATMFDAGESPRWTQLSSQFAPWTPTPMLQTLAERMGTWLD